jgi:hypothetical protein
MIKITKELVFDLDFQADGKIKPLTRNGVTFLESLGGDTVVSKQVYHAAIDGGLHIRFGDAKTRDRVSGF